MREIIDEILNGNYGRETGSLDFSQASLEISALQGEETSGSFWIRGDGAWNLKGKIYSTDYRMECLTPEFASAEAEIFYVFHGEGAEIGEVIKGAFRVISNLGEYSLPYAVTCEGRQLESSQGPVRNLSEFVALARENRQEALSLFYSESFPELLGREKAELLPIYRGLSVYDGHEQNMEEFLIRAGQKQFVTFQTDASQINLEIFPLEGEYQPLERELAITKNGCGYVALNVECEGGFLEPDRTLLTEEDFLGNVARLSVFLDATRLHPGENRGRILFYNSFTGMETEVVVRLGDSHLVSQAGRRWKQTIVSVMKQYERFRTRKIGLEGWLEETGELVEQLVALDENAPMPRLFKAQLLITRDRQNEAQWLLDYAADLMENGGKYDEELWAYYLYLTTLISRNEEQINQVAEEVEEIYRRNPDSWRIAWLLLYLSQEYATLPSERLRFLEKQFDYGCRSFVIYLEALQIYLNNPSMIRKLGPFEKQVLHYGIRKDYFSQEIAERFLELMDKNKEYSPLLCHILERLYKKRKDVRIVSHMCTQLVKGGVQGESALPWYEKGVEEQLRITNLYESFMASIRPEERKGLPKAAVLYFSYQNKLDYERSAFLYDHVLDNKVLYPEVYEKYLLKCRDFVAQQIDKGRINRHLARLYVKLHTPELIHEKNAEVMTRLVFTSRIRVKDDRMKKVVIYAKGSTLGREYPLAGGEALAPIYGEESTLIFEDGFGNRFADEISREVETFLQPEDFLQDLVKYDVSVPEFDLYLLERAKDDSLEDWLAARALRLCGFSGLDPDAKGRICLRLLKEFYDGEQPEKLEEVLDALEGVPLSPEDRMEASRYALLQGNYEQPFAWMQTYGPYYLDANTLARLTARKLSASQEEDPCLVAACAYLFHRGKANVAMLDYLGRFGEGTLKELRDLWNAMRENSLEVTGLEERILVQMIFTGGYVAERKEIFEEYDRSCRESTVSRAFVIQSCFDYFVREKTADGILFHYLLDEYKEGGHLPKVCKLAFLRYYAENPAEVTREVDGALDAFLREMMAEKLHFDFYRNLRHQRSLTEELADKVIVEYRARPGGKARIHYVITRDGAASQEYLSETMRDVFWGICCKEFILFFGEVLEYYVTEEIDGRETMTTKGSLQCPAPEPETAGTKFGMINDMVISQSMGEDDALDEALENYYYKEFCGENLFILR